MKQTVNYILTIILVCLSSCQNFVDNALDDKTYSDTIKQKIGGDLIRNIHYFNDFHSWYYNIQYSYRKLPDSSHIIGTGTYRGQDLPIDEQVSTFGNWTILKTGNSFNGDKIFIGDLQKNSWAEYEISPEAIEKDSIWQLYKINPDLERSTHLKVRIENVKGNGEFTVIYEYVKKLQTFSFLKDKSKINYKINLNTGIPEIINVTEL